MSDLLTPIPTKWVGPIRVSGNAVQGEHEVPLATYESPLWPSVGRGARISRMVEDGIVATVVDERMTRSVVVRADSAAAAHVAAGQILARQDELAAIDALDTGKRGGPAPEAVTLESFGRDIPEA